MSDDPNTVYFDYGVWIARYPEFINAVDPPLGQALFNEAVLMLDNTGGSRVIDMTERAMFLGMLMAHLAQLRAMSAGQGGGAGLVGPINSASQGSVSVSVTPLGTGGNAMQTWLSQTQYGAQYWALTAGYRTARYIPRPRPYLGVAPVYGRGGGWY